MKNKIHKERSRLRMERRNAPSLKTWQESEAQHLGEPLAANAVVECGWGRLIFGHTFPDPAELARSLAEEKRGQRDLALYLQDPHVVLALAPQELFLDPSHTYRLWFFNYRPGRIQPRGFIVRRMQTAADAEAIHRLLLSRSMVPGPPEFAWTNRRSRVLQYFVAEDPETNRVVGTVMGVDHSEAFSDPENGSSMWCLAVDPQARLPGIGRALVAHIADRFAARGRAFMDLSVMHDNEAVIRLYEQMGFVRVPAFCLKTKNAINEPLFTGPAPEEHLNPYGRIIVDEARRRGIAVRMLDAEEGYFSLTLGGRSIVCRESLTELTSAIAMSRCDDKRVTRGLVNEAGISVPAQIEACDQQDARKFLAQYGTVVVKPARGEQGRGVAVRLSTDADVAEAIRDAAVSSDRVLMEEYIEGLDLRVVVIGFEVVAAAIRHPAAITGNGRDPIELLIEKQSRRREAATGGESRIPMDDETRRCIRRRGYRLDDILPLEETIKVRETANLHTGGLLEDVTDRLSESLREASVQIAKILNIPVVGLDFIVDSPESGRFSFIEANERPGLANHEPQLTAERFIDFLFPQTVTQE
jgi:GNAT-family acetyltransferase (TIGR03103 family)